MTVDGTEAPSAPPAPALCEPSGIALSCLSECRDVSFSEAKEMLILAHLKAPADNTDGKDERPPLSITSVIDRSGSMSGDKIQLVKMSMMFVIEQMRATDEFGIVSYDDHVKEELRLTKMDANGKREALQAVDRIQPGGSTNLSGGMFAGLEQQGCPVILPSEPQPQHLFECDVQPARNAPVPQILELVVGNKHTLLEVSEGDKSQHDWTAYVRCSNPDVDLNKYIEKVRFQLHPTFNPAVVEITKAPYQIRRIGWGYFDIQATICVRAEFGGSEHTVTLSLNFGADDTNKSFVIALNPPRQTSVVTQRVIGEGAGVPSVWLFTDGLANAGIVDPELLRKEALARLELVPKCTLFTFGFGSDHNGDLLKDLAAAGSGVYYYVEKQHQISESFADCLGGLTSVVAQNLRLRLQLHSGTTLMQLVTSYKHTVDGNTAEITLRDMYSEEERDVIVHVRVAQQPQPVPVPELLASWHLEYVNTAPNCATPTGTAAAELHIGRPEKAEPHDPPALLDQQRNRLRCTEAMQQAQLLGDAGKLEEGRKVLDEAIASIKSSATGNDKFCQHLIKDLLETKDGLRDRTEYMNVGKHKMAWKQSEHQQQRSANSSCYTNLKKENMKMMLH